MEPNYGNKYQLKGVFLNAFSKTGIIKHACYMAGIAETTFYRWYGNDAKFQDEYVKAGYEAVKMNGENLKTVPEHKRNFAVQVGFDIVEDELNQL